MSVWLWIAFVALVLLLMALDLGVLNRKDHLIGAREALLWTGFWIMLALLFNLAVYFIYQHQWLGMGIVEGQAGQLFELPSSASTLTGPLRGDVDLAYRIPGQVAAIEYFTGYLVEKALSLDNIFVIALVFRYFKVPGQFQHRVLFWGILGALVMRGAMIGAGVVLIQKFSWAIYVFGGFLVVTAVRMLVTQESEPDLDQSRLVRAVRRILPVSDGIRDHSFFTRQAGEAGRGAGRWAVTPLFLVLIVVEVSDVLFAVDSIPAIFAITRDPFIVFTSNIFAILGLRSLYFAVAQLLRRFFYLQYSLAVILAYVGVKMILSHYYPIPAVTSLLVIGGLLAVGVIASVTRNWLMARSAGPGSGNSNDSEEGGGR